MGIHEKPVDRGSERGRNACRRFGQELRRARRERGPSQRVVASQVGVSMMQVSRVERGLAPALSIVQSCRLAAVVGLELSLRAYPDGSPVHDARHLQLIAKAVATLKAEGRYAREVPLPIQGDRRAWDAVVDLPGGRIGLEIESVLEDIQALQRRVALKLRDDPSIRLAILVIPRTRHNRHVLAEHRPALMTDFPLQPDSVIAAVTAGLVPAANGILLL